MFTWICEKCKAEVPPAYDACPRCFPPSAGTGAVQSAEPTAAAAPAAAPAAPVAPTAPVAPAAPVPQVQGYAPAPAAQPVHPYAPPPAQAYAPPPAQAYAPPAQAYAAPAAAPSTTLRDMVVTLVVAAALLGGGYFVWTRNEAGGAKEAAAAKAELEPVGERKSTHPLAKQIEVTGIRLQVPKPGQAEVKMLVVNHSAADLVNLAIDVVLGGKGTTKEVATFEVKVKRLPPFGSAEVTAKTKTEVPAIDIPDWQFLEAKTAIRSDVP